jgi:hypothetical protein
MNITILPPIRPTLTEIAFCRWLGEAAPGAIVEYHRGFLCLDCFGDPRSPERHALRELARRAAWASDHGLVHLLQKRHGPRDYGYLAIKRPDPRKKAWALVHTDPVPDDARLVEVAGEPRGVEPLVVVQRRFVGEATR